MKVDLAFIGSSISSFGFRLLASLVRAEFQDTRVHYVVAQNFRRLSAILKSDASSRLSESDIDAIAKRLAEADIVGISSFSEYATLTRDIIKAVRRRNPNAFIIWGGVHPTAHPEDAVQVADAICIGEGERALMDFLRRKRDGEDFTGVGNFWFRRDGEIIRNSALPLLDSNELNELPHPHYGADEHIFMVGEHSFRPIRVDDYLELDALSYNTVWSRGCPFKCTYCGNTRLLELDSGYGRVRHSSVDHIIDEVEQAVKVFPHISYAAFHDDCMISMPTELLQEFAEKWRQRIGLPFAVQGVTPAHIRDKKIRILLSGGLNRVRMGVQSGSDNILKFYRRPNRPGLVKDATNILGRYGHVMIPPAYDMIFDNPVETAEDVQATLALLHDTPRPFTLNIFSLRHIPNTELGRQLSALDMDIESIESDYTSVMPTFANALMYLDATVRLPDWLFNRLLPHCKPYLQSRNPLWRPLILLLRGLFMAKRAFYHLRWLDFSIILGKPGAFLHRFGLRDRIRRRPNSFEDLMPLPSSESGR